MVHASEYYPSPCARVLVGTAYFKFPTLNKRTGVTYMAYYKLYRYLGNSNTKALISRH